MKKTIAFEGLSGSGKTTIIKGLQGLIVDSLVLNTPRSEILKPHQQYYTSLDKQSKALYYLLACSEVSYYIQQYKSTNNILIDRYILSMDAYLNDNLSFNMSNFDFEKPDLIIAIDIEDEIRKERIIKRQNINGSDLDLFLSNRNKNYDHNQRARDIFIAGADVVINNNSEDRASITNQILTLV